MPKNILLAATLPAAAAELYDMYLDSAAHSAFTGQPVKIQATAGAPFSAFAGQLSGVMLHAEPKRYIVQRWRSTAWAADVMDSILILTFVPEGENGRIELAHINVDETDFAGVSHGWEKYYWTPWRNYLENRGQ